MKRKAGMAVWFMYCLAAVPVPVALADPIHEAAGAGKVEMLRRVLAEGADVNARSGNGATPLHDAAMWGHRDISELLLAKGADVNAKDANGMTPLHFAANGDHKALAALLLEKGAVVDAKASNGWTPLHVAAAWGHTSVAGVFIANGAVVNARADGGDKPLRPVENAVRCHKDVNALIGKAGVWVQGKGGAGMTPLRVAVLNGQKDMAEFLRKHGARE